MSLAIWCFLSCRTLYLRHLSWFACGVSTTRARSRHRGWWSNATSACTCTASKLSAISRPSQHEPARAHYPLPPAIPGDLRSPGSCRGAGMIHTRVLSARAATCCRSLASAGVRRWGAAAPVTLVIPKAQRRAFGSTQLQLREKFTPGGSAPTESVTLPGSEPNPAFSDIAFAFEYVISPMTGL